MDTSKKPSDQTLIEKPAENMVPCRVCREPVRQGARKCIHCDSMLDWRGWLGISETALALLVALVSVIGAAAPRVVELFTPKFSALQLSFRQVFSNNLEMMAVNQGNRNSQVLSGTISAITEDGNQLDPIGLQIGGIPSVPAEQATLDELAIPLSAVPTFLNWPHLKIRSTKLTIVVSEYKRGQETREINVPVEYFRLFCRATEDADWLLRHQGQQLVDMRLVTVCIPHSK